MRDLYGFVGQNSVGSLSPQRFTYNSVEYTVPWLAYEIKSASTSELRFNVVGRDGSSFPMEALRLCLDTITVDFTYPGGNQGMVMPLSYRLYWEVIKTVEVKLIRQTQLCDPPVATITARITPVTEGDLVQYTIRLSKGAPATGLTVNLSVDDAAGSDFVSPADQAKTAEEFLPGEHETVFWMRTTRDTADEPDGDVTVTLLPGTGYILGDPSSASVEVQDNDDPRRIDWRGRFMEAPANDGSVTGRVTATLTGGRFTGNVATVHPSNLANVPTGLSVRFVPLYTHVYTTPPSSYISGVVIMLDGNAAEHADENDVDNLEVIFFNSDFVGGNANTVINYSNDGLVIDFNDPYPEPTVTIAPKTTQVTEGDPAEYTLSLSRGAPPDGLTVNVSVMDATAGSDFVATSDEGMKTVTVAVGEIEATFRVSTVADTADEPDGNVTVTLQSGMGYRVGDMDSASVTVNNNDNPTVAPPPVTPPPPTTVTPPSTNNPGGEPPPREEETEQIEVCAVSGVTGNDESLRELVECAAEEIEESDSFGKTLALLEEWRDEEGKWNDGERYLVLLTKRGGVYFHADDREAEDLDWSGVLSCEEGGSVLDTEEGCFIEYEEGERNGYAHPLSASHVPLAHGEEKFVLLGGFDETPEGRPFAGEIGEPSTQAGDVDTDEELRDFVEEGGTSLKEAVENSEIDPAELRGILRQKGPWREGEVYVFIMDEMGRVIFDGADRNREQKDESAKQYIRNIIAEAGEKIVEYTEGDSLRRDYAVRVEVPLNADEGRVYVVGSGYRVVEEPMPEPMPEPEPEPELEPEPMPEPEPDVEEEPKEEVEAISPYVEEEQETGPEPEPSGNGGGCALSGGNNSGGVGLSVAALALLLAVLLERRRPAENRTR